MVDVVGLILVIAVVAGGYYLIKSGALNNLVPAPVAAPVEGGNTIPVGTDTTTTPTGTTPTTTTPAATDPLQALLDALTGQGGSNTLPTTGGGATQPPIQQPPIYQGNPQECSSRYNGKCDTECKSGNTSLCQSCQMACGGAQTGVVGAVQTLPPMGGSTNPSLCKSKYNGKCNTECQSGNSSECAACKQACGSFRAYAYYIQTPMNPMTSTVFRNNNYSSAYSANWDIGVQNAR